VTTIGQTAAETIGALLAAHGGWIGAAFALYVLAWFAASARWRLVVRALGGRLGWIDAGLATIAGVCVNNITPTGRLGGEACRIAITRMKGELSLTRGALATLGDRLTDVPLVAAVAAFALPALPPIAGTRARGALIVVAVVALLLAVGTRWLRRVAHTWVNWWRREGVTIDRSTAAAAFGFSSLVWIEDVLRLMAVGLALDVSLSAPQAAALVVAGVFGGFVPSIGGVGAVEGALVGVLVLFGVPLEKAIAVTAVERAISFGFSTVLGGLVVAMLGGRRLWRPMAS
jgi:uncharacterized membrane protein YbhN (UPF0104 family)